MKIIDNKKDYYDHISVLYGIDDDVVYDRRGSVALNSEGAFRQGMGYLFGDRMLPDDKPRTQKSYWNLQSIVKYQAALSTPYRERRKQVWQEGDVYHFILEVGHIHYRFEVERWLDERGNVLLEHRLIDSKRAGERYSSAPMCLIPCHGRYGHLSVDGKWIETNEEAMHRIENPILDGTFIAKVIPPADIWQQLYEYLSSLRDIPFSDTRTDAQRLESAGFDRKTSFRNIK